MVTPIIQDLRVQPLSAIPESGGVPDTEGFYYKAGETVKIIDDRTVGKMDLTAGEVSIGILQTSLSTTQRPGGLDARDRIAVLTRYNFLARGVAEGPLTAGQYIVDGDTTAGTFRVYNSAGGDTPDMIRGVVWKGALDAAEFEYLM